MTMSTEPLAPAVQHQPSSPDVSSRVPTDSVRSVVSDAVLFTFYGLLNNGLICVVYGAAQDIVKGFGYPDADPLVTLISTGSAIVAPVLLLTWPLRKLGYRVRVILICFIGLAGLLLLSFSTLAMKSSLSGMLVGMLAVFLVGLQQGLGENCACIRFRRFSKIALSCWGAGTGFAGIFPNMLYDAISHWPLHSRFLVVVPLLAVYLVVCLMVYNAGRKDEDGVSVQPCEDPAEVRSPALEDGSRTAADGSEEPVGCFAWYVIFIFAGVYSLEYFIFPTLVDRATKCPPTSPLGNQAYNDSWIAYNIGVTISRGSIAFFQFPCIWLVMILQAVNLVVWVVDVRIQFLGQMKAAGYIAQYLLMVWVGLMGGTAYANCIRIFHSSPRIPNVRRDQLINYAFAIGMTGMMASTALGLLLDNTVLSLKTVTSFCPAA